MSCSPSGCARHGEGRRLHTTTSRRHGSGNQDQTMTRVRVTHVRKIVQVVSADGVVFELAARRGVEHGGA